jgi:transposase
MGASAEAIITDKLGRRTGPRRTYTIAEKRAWVEETHVYGASVPEVAQRHGVNPNLLSVWRRLYKRGLLNATQRSDAALLPVKVSTPTMLPSERATALKKKQEPSAVIEVEFATGACLRIRGSLDRMLLKELISALSGR